ncbi:MAG: VOC family protein [Gemmataceae bacterium]|nr:VOC family protein [Gemmataceae bacterium]
MAVAPIPPGFTSVTPHLVIRGVAKAIEFYKKAFVAEEIIRMPGMTEDSIGHAEIKIGNSIVMLADEWPGIRVASPEKFGGTTVSIMLYVKDCDAAFNQAVAAGATVSMPLMNMFWGDRFGKVTDPFGHEWAIATHVEDVTPEECARRGDKAMKQMCAK